MTTPRKTEAEIGLGAEERAIEEGHRAWIAEGGAIEVVSDTQIGVRYRVTFDVAPGNFIHFHCTCRAGECRPHLLVPCKHSTLAGRRLEREGFAEWHDGRFVLAAKFADTLPDVTVPDNLLEGLPQ
jgi:hypothetical protein